VNLVSVEDVAELVDYGVTTSSEVESTGPKFLRITDIQDGAVNWSSVPHCLSSAKGVDKARLAPGDIVFARTGATTGKSFLIKNCPQDAVFASYLIRLRLEHCADPSYVAHYFQTPEYWRQISSVSEGVAQPGVNATKLRDLKIPLPPIEEQRRIAAILDAADALRAKRRQALAKLDTLTQAIFIDIFGDPVSNPKGWPDATVDGVLDFLTYGHRFYDDAYTDFGTPLVRITDLNEAGVLDFESMPRMDLSDEERDKYRVSAGDLLFARSGATVGKVALIRGADPECIAGAYFVWMRFADHVNPEYARCVLTSDRVRGLIAKRSRQAAQQNFSGPAIRRLPMPVPPMSLQTEFAERVDRVRLEGSRHVASCARFDTLFACLQQRAFRGEL